LRVLAGRGSLLARLRGGVGVLYRVTVGAPGRVGVLYRVAVGVPGGVGVLGAVGVRRRVGVGVPGGVRLVDLVGGVGFSGGGLVMGRGIRGWMWMRIRLRWLGLFCWTS
jgi:hypothetical protein